MFSITLIESLKMSNALLLFEPIANLIFLNPKKYFKKKLLEVPKYQPIKQLNNNFARKG